MRKQDLDVLGAPYQPAPRRVDDQFGDALQLQLKEVRALEDAIYVDLDPTHFGIGWWHAYEPRFGVRARIYVSDYLYRSAASIETNLIEAKLHYLEALDAFEREDTRLGRMLAIGPGGVPMLKHPRSEKALDDLAQHLSTMHTAGFFRALASAFDCVGACIQGVLALNGWILTQSSFGAVRGALSNLSPDPQRDVERKAIRQRIIDVVATAGPPGWLEWMLHYRHMLVHRARRFELTTIKVEPAPDGDASAIARTRPIPQLARDPARSDIEMWHDVQSPPVLTESAQSTMERILASSETTIREITGALLDFWRWRKQNVGALAQPSGQWPNDAAGEVTGFGGYHPGQVAFQPGSMTASPFALQRLRAASLADGYNNNWPEFGGKGSNQ